MRMIEDIGSVMARPHRAGWPFIGGGLLVMLTGLAFSVWLFWPGLIFALFCLYFFRDPERTPPERPTAVLAPADGRVVMVGPAVPPVELGLGDAPRWRVAIFLSVLNVHVNRVPASGTVTRVAYQPGAFVSASMDKASDSNERNGIAIRIADGRELGVVQIAGLIARRILCHVRPGDPVQAGHRFGLIRFGSRTDLYLPPGVKPLVVEGQSMIGGETVIADLSGVPI